MEHWIQGILEKTKKLIKTITIRKNGGGQNQPLKIRNDHQEIDFLTLRDIPQIHLCSFHLVGHPEDIKKAKFLEIWTLVITFRTIFQFDRSISHLTGNVNKHGPKLVKLPDSPGISCYTNRSRSSLELR